MTTLMEAAAFRKAGRQVTVRFQRPNTSEANGAAYLDLTGRVVIDIDPIWLHDHGQLFKIFTHELAHVVLHTASMRAVEIDAAPLVSPSKCEDVVTMKREQEAEELANVWRTQVENPNEGITYFLRRL
jgi:hypothetical protein